jgi:ribosome modulation factor
MRTVLSKLEIIHDQGYAAYNDGIARSLNPYPVGSTEEAAWFEGWDYGKKCGGACR